MEKDSVAEELVEDEALLEEPAAELATEEAIEDEATIEFSAEFEVEDDVEKAEETPSPLLGLRSALDRLRGATAARREAAIFKVEVEELSDQLAAARDTIEWQEEQIKRGEEMLAEALAGVEEAKELLAQEQSKAEALEAEVESLPEKAAAKAQEDLASLGVEIDRLPAAESDGEEVDLTNSEAVAAEVARLQEAGEHGQATALRSAALRLKLGA